MLVKVGPERSGMSGWCKRIIDIFRNVRIGKVPTDGAGGIKNIFWTENISAEIYIKHK